MRVLIFDPSNRNPVHSARLVEALSSICDVEVVMPYRREESEISSGEVVDKCRKLRLRTFKGGCKLPTYFRGWFYVLKNANKYDIIHIEWLSLLDRSSIELILLKLLLKKNPNIVYTIHDVLPLYRKNNKRVLKRFQRLYNLIPAIRVHSNFAKKTLESLFAIEKSKVYINDLAPLLEIDVPKQIDMDANYIGIIGTLSKYKGITDAILAFSLISDKVSENLLLAGGIDSAYRKEIEKMIADLKISKRVELIFRYLTVQEVITLHRKVKVTILPYNQITQSGAALTSMALGVPVVAYDVGAMSEYVTTGYNGYLVEKGNVESLAKAIEEILKDKGENFRRNCLDYSNMRSWSTVAKQTIQVYEYLLLNERR